VLKSGAHSIAVALPAHRRRRGVSITPENFN